MPNYPASLDTQITVYDDGSSITDTGRVVATGGILGANYGFVLGVGPAGVTVRNIPRGGFVQGPGTATAGTYTGTASAGGGQMATGSYRYQVTLVTQFGETAPYTVNGDVAVTGPTGSVYLAGLPLAGPTVTLANPVIARKIYRTTVAGGVSGSKFLVGIIDDALATFYTDTIPDSEAGTQVAPAADTSGVGGIVVPTATVSGHAITFTEVFLTDANPSGALPPADLATLWTCQFSVDYSYGATGGTVYFPSNFNAQTVTVTYVGGTVPTASLITALSSQVVALETNAANLNAPAQQTGSVNVGGDVTAGGHLLASGGLPTNSTAHAILGAKRWFMAQTGGDNSSAGQFDYRGLDAASLSIVGAGTGSTGRKIKLWDDVTVVGGLTVGSSAVATLDASSHVLQAPAAGIRQIVNWMLVSTLTLNGTGAVYAGFPTPTTPASYPSITIQANSKILVVVNITFSSTATQSILIGVEAQIGGYTLQFGAANVSAVPPGGYTIGTGCVSGSVSTGALAAGTYSVSFSYTTGISINGLSIIPGPWGALTVQLIEYA